MMGMRVCPSRLLARPPVISLRRSLATTAPSPSPPSASPPSSAPEPRKSKKKGSRGNPVTDSLAPLDTIRISPPSAAAPAAAADAAADAAPPRETKEERRAAAAADKFFRRGYDFLYSAEGLPTHRPNTTTPEVVVLGASNAGKSTFLNSLLGRTDAARVSSRPGHTSTMNAFGIGRKPNFQPNSSPPKGPKTGSAHGLVLVDTPGYGHASRAGWGDSICRYVERRSMLRGAVVLLPAQKSLSRMDRWVLRMLAERNKRVLVVLTKADMAGREWWPACRTLAGDVTTQLAMLEDQLRGTNGGWHRGDGWVPDVYATAAGWARRRSVAAAPGVSGVRAAILQHLAGLTLVDGAAQTSPADVVYDGDVVSWDDLLAQTDK